MTLQDKKQALQTAVQNKQELSKYLSEIPSLKRKLVYNLAGATSKTERKRLKDQLDDLVLDEEIVPLQLEEAQYQELEARVQANAAEIREFESQAGPIREEADEAETKKQYWQKIEEEKRSLSRDLGYRIQKLRDSNQVLVRDVNKERQKAAVRQEQVEQPRV